ncbi:MAG: hypothetical protein ACJA1A_003537 [Saprospiraceae bacterium]|jgi:hypothetical protein
MIDYYDHIDDYVNGLLTGAELDAFEAAMVEDSGLADAVANHDVAMEVIGSLMEDEVRGVIGEVERESTSSLAQDVDSQDVQKGKIRWMKVIRIVAAACVVGVLGYWGISNLTNEEQVLFAEVNSEPAWPSQRGDEANSLSDIFGQYFSGKKNKAKIELKLSKMEDAPLWLSEIYLQEEKFDSVLIFLPTDTNSIKIKRDRINYLKILSLYYLKNPIEAIAVYKNLPKDTDQFYLDIYTKLSLAE